MAISMDEYLGSIAQRLRAARETAGLSARAVASRLQGMGLTVSHATLCNYETGRTMPTVDLIAALAQVYGTSREWMLSRGPMFTGTRYRALKAVRVADKRAFEGEALGWFQAYLAAEEAVNDPLQPPRSPFRIKPDESGRAVARRIRDEYDLGDYPIPSVMRLIENFGVRIIQQSSSARIDGFAAWFGPVSVVVVNQSLSNDRIRMNAAHELAHHLFKDCVDGGSLDDDDVERRAFECASHLLLPDTSLKMAFELKSMVRLVQYKVRFGMSLAAMIYRARQDRLIPANLYQHIWVEFGRLGWRRDEPGYVPPDRPIRMECLFDAADRRRRMTYPQIASLAGVDERVVRQRVICAMGGSPDLPNPRQPTTSYNFDAYRRELPSPKE
jgi:Zn-dependent peptidase ImmA (M78 family)/DNA-binding XRE family transcriptional regulator